MEKADILECLNYSLWSLRELEEILLGKESLSNEEESLLLEVKDRIKKVLKVIDFANCV